MLRLRTAPIRTFGARLIVVALAFAFVVGPATEGNAGHNISTGAYARTIKSLNLRTGPSTSYSVKLTIPCGGRPYVVSGPYNSSWYKVSYSSTSGYVYGAYLTARRATTVRTLGTSSNVVALTFDAGSDRGYAGQILDTLKAKGVKASFGATGKWVGANPDLARRMATEGHIFINHSYSHPSFTGYSTNSAPLTYSERESQLHGGESAVATATGRTSKPYFRPPYGDYNDCVISHVRHEGYRYNVMWSTDSGGWRGISKSQIVQNVLAGLKPGAIYVLHVGSASQDGPALATIIDEIRRRGYGFATLAQYLG